MLGVSDDQQLGVDGMNIQNPRRSCNVPRTQKVSATPASAKVFQIGGAIKETAFPGWPTIHHVADREDVVIRREGDCVHVFCVDPIHAIEFWGHA